MREAFLISLSMLAMYLLAVYWRARNLRYLLVTALITLCTIPLSSPFFLLLVAILVIESAAITNWRFLRSRRMWVVLGALLILGIGVLIVLGYGSQYWLEAGQWQRYINANASGWVERQFRRMPDWTHVPFLVMYGVLRPLLPSALIASAAPAWRLIAIWRALGWTLLLVLLCYTTYLAICKQDERKMAGWFMLIMWVFFIVASYRSGGDQWDNPRYRATFAGLQVVLAAWALVKQRQSGDRWLWRTLGAASMMVLWFLPWYLRRYPIFPFTWTVIDLVDVIGIGLVSGLLFFLWDWVGQMGKIK
jgi:hypothetical protein